MKQTTLFGLLLFFSGLNFGQGLSGAERTSRKFADAINRENFERALSYTMSDAYDMVLKGFVRGNYNEDDLAIRILDCRAEWSNYGAECECNAMVDGRRSFLLFSLTSVDNKWFIYHLESKRNYQKDNLSEKELFGQYDFKMDPVETLNEFAALSAAGDYKKALKYTVISARNEYVRMTTENPESLPVKIWDVNCSGSGRTVMLECSCSVLSQKGDTAQLSYTLAPVNKMWRIVEFSGVGNVYRVVNDFVTALADGNCEKAMALTAGPATELVQGNIDAGCVSYGTEIISIECETNEVESSCECTEKRDGMEMTFHYDLKNYNGKWHIVNYEKDFENMEVEGAGGQDTTKNTGVNVNVVIDEELVCAEPDSLASFPGGEDSLKHFIMNELRYPDVARRAGIEGTVTVNFVVEEEGDIYIFMVKNGVQKAMDEEAIRIVASMPTWTPAFKNGQPVRTWCSIEVVFKI